MESKRSIRNVAVFCGSKEGKHPEYAAQAKELGTMLAQRKTVLVYGGGNKGLMGIVANAAMENGGTVRGVIPKILTDWEHQHTGLSELLVTDGMHARKVKMYEWCDAIVILPGGFGTLDELFEVLTWNQLSIHDKKVFILNTRSFYTRLLDHLRYLTDEGFLWGDFDEQITVLSEPAQLLKYLD